jgi:hypothetical protein
MINIEFKPVGLEGMIKNVKTGKYFQKYISKAVERGLWVVRNNSFDGSNGSNFFNFKNARKDRTGDLANNFRAKSASEVKSLVFHGNKITAITFSRMKYADFVASKNDFYGRILKHSERKIDKSFDIEIEEAMKSLGFN